MKRKLLNAIILGKSLLFSQEKSCYNTDVYDMLKYHDKLLSHFDANSQKCMMRDRTFEENRETGHFELPFSIPN